VSKRDFGLCTGIMILVCLALFFSLIVLPWAIWWALTYLKLITVEWNIYTWLAILLLMFLFGGGIRVNSR